MHAFLNIAAYRFVGIDDVHALAERLLARTKALGLKGTILLAAEGINLSLAAPPEPLRVFVEELHSDARFTGMEIKESWSPEQPFRRMLVRERAEIIRLAAPTIRPGPDRAGRAPAVDPHTLKRWLDQGHDDAGRAIVLLDTRNAFEVEEGTFDGAIDLRIERFTQLPAALAPRRAQFTGKTVVTFCTGGIRCEKAAILMREEGIPDVVQLDGGILRYFEVIGGAHYHGSCYVFDRRRALDTALQVTALRT